MKFKYFVLPFLAEAIKYNVDTDGKYTTYDSTMSCARCIMSKNVFCKQNYWWQQWTDKSSEAEYKGVCC